MADGRSQLEGEEEGGEHGSVGQILDLPLGEDVHSESVSHEEE